jgi:aminomethyltransferase
MVEFSGWKMPINYGSQIEEHHHVRNDAGMFDVSHMTVVDITGAEARPYLRRLLANDVDKLTTQGRALYSCMLNDRGGVLDDLICYFMNPGHYRLVVNAATRDKDLAWMSAQTGGTDVIINELHGQAMIAVQGPNARQLASEVLKKEWLTESDVERVIALKPFSAVQCGELFVARTGYTGEDGFEIVLPDATAVRLWYALAAAGVHPCGLGARDTLRLEAGMNLYGQDMDETVTPLESALGWTISLTGERDFIGRGALVAQQDAGVQSRLVGLVLSGRGVLRPGQAVRAGSPEADLAEGSEEGQEDGQKDREKNSTPGGAVTSGSFSPTLSAAIAFARIPAGDALTCEVDVRGKWLRARIVRPPFVRHGKACEGII